MRTFSAALFLASLVGMAQALPQTKNAFAEAAELDRTALGGIVKEIITNRAEAPSSVAPANPPNGAVSSVAGGSPAYGTPEYCEQYIEPALIYACLNSAAGNPNHWQKN